MNICCVCKTKLNSHNQSEEHIIPNTLGGKLKSTQLLCIECNSRLGTEVDEPFCRTFDLFIKKMDLGKDRKKGSGKVEGRLISKGAEFIEVITKNHKVFPKKPFCEIDEKEKIIHVYGARKVAQQYLKKVRSELSTKSSTYDNYQVKFIDDITGIIEHDFNINNKDFLPGLFKIATNYALYKGIKQEDLIYTFNKENDFKFDDKVIPYIPLSSFDILFENCRSFIDVYYPNHILVLFSQDYYDGHILKRDLICYVELFSTFQFYVILNKDFKGEPIYEHYIQTVISRESNEIDLTNWDYKELYALSQESGIDYRKLGEKAKKGKKLLIHNPYEVPISEYIDGIFTEYMFALTFSESNNEVMYNKRDKHRNKANKISSYPLFKYLQEIDSNEKFLISLYLRNHFYTVNKNGKQIIKPLDYKIRYLDDSGTVKYYLDELPKHYISNHRDFYNYNKMKVEQLNKYVSYHSFQHKSEG